MSLLFGPARAIIFLFLFALTIRTAVADARRRVNLEQERPLTLPRGFTRLGPARHSDVITLRIGVKQANLAWLERNLLDVSNPTSPNYGSYFSRHEIAEKIYSPESHAATKAWLLSHDADIIHESYYKDWIQFRVPVSTAERMFDNQFQEYVHEKSGVRFRRATHYTLPAEVAEHADAVLGILLSHSLTYRLDGRVRRRMAGPSSGVLRGNQQFAEGEMSSKQVNPNFLAQYYKMSPNWATSGQSSQCIFEALQQYYSHKDLKFFFSYFNLTGPANLTLIGENDPKNPGDECSLDLQYIMGTALNVPTTVWSFGEDDDDDPILAYVLAINNAISPPLVHSISYGGPLNEIPVSTVRRFDSEAMKAGLRGLTITVASGDDGAAGYGARDDYQTCRFPPFQATWPATSPWVTAVGATMLNSTDQEVVASSAKGALITTGGGFSTWHSRPAYQETAVSDYLKVADGMNLIPPKNFFLNTKRAYPDVSVLGHNYVVVVGKPNMYLVDGTSASSPVFAGMVSLLNDDRFNKGMKAMGFINPFLYQTYQRDPTIFTDIVQGHNKCPAACEQPCTLRCCNFGYFAVPGWDAVTGLGTPDFSKLRAAAVASPA